jgi:hypothetical protein
MTEELRAKFLKFVNDSYPDENLHDRLNHDIFLEQNGITDKDDDLIEEILSFKFHIIESSMAWLYGLRK